MNYQFGHAKRFQRMNEVIKTYPEFLHGMEIKCTESGYGLYRFGKMYQTAVSSAMLSRASKQVAEEAARVALEIHHH
jgi:hypothetical protein